MAEEKPLRRATRLARRQQIEASRGTAGKPPQPPPVAPDVALFQRLNTRLAGEAQLSALDIERLTGIPMERLRTLWRALGFPPVAEDQPVFSNRDVEMLARVGELQREQGTADDVVLQLVRVSGQALARIAETQVELFGQRDGAGPAFDEERLAARLTALEPFLRYIWRRHLAAAVARKLLIGDRIAGENVLIVGFADLVGFTELSRNLEARALAEVIERFERNVYESVPQHHGRVIKMLGDEVMFAAADAAAGAAIACDLVELHANATNLPAIRVGLALGPVLQWEGDLFGTTVNLASRLVDVARASTVLISEEMAEALADHPDYTRRRLRRKKLKGLGAVHPWRLNRAASNISQRQRGAARGVK